MSEQRQDFVSRYLQFDRPEDRPETLEGRISCIIDGAIQERYRGVGDISAPVSAVLAEFGKLAAAAAPSAEEGERNDAWWQEYERERLRKIPNRLRKVKVGPDSELHSAGYLAGYEDGFDDVRDLVKRMIEEAQGAARRALDDRTKPREP